MKFAKILKKLTYKLNYMLNCDELSDLSSHMKVLGKQYVEEITDEFRLRWKNYKSNDRINAWNEAFRQEHLFQHFIIEGYSGFLGDVSITPIDKTNVKDPKRKEIIG